MVYDREFLDAGAEDTRQLVDFLKFAVFDLRTIGAVDAVIMIVFDDFTLEVGSARWLVDAANIPTCGFFVENSFDLCIVIKCHTINNSKYVGLRQHGLNLPKATYVVK